MQNIIGRSTVMYICTSLVSKTNFKIRFGLENKKLLYLILVVFQSET